MGQFEKDTETYVDESGKMVTISKARKRYAASALLEGTSTRKRLQKVAEQTGISLNRVYQLRKDGNLQDWIRMKCAEKGLTIEQSIEIIKDAMGATVVGKDGEKTKTPDHKIRLTANNQFLDLAGYTGPNSKQNEVKEADSTVPMVTVEEVIEYYGNEEAIKKRMTARKDAVITGRILEKQIVEGGTEVSDEDG